MKPFTEIRKFFAMNIRPIGFLAAVLIFGGCSMAYDPSGDESAAADSSSGGAGGVGGAPPTLSITSLTIAGTTTSSATVTINGLSDQNASATAWSRSSTPSSAALADGFEQTVIATNANGSTTLLVMVAAGD